MKTAFDPLATGLYFVVMLAGTWLLAIKPLTTPRSHLDGLSQEQLQRHYARTAQMQVEFELCSPLVTGDWEAKPGCPEHRQ